MDEFDVIDIPVVDSEELQDEISAKSAWIVGEDIIPSIYYQAYSASAAWNSDDESTYKVWIENPTETPEVMAGPKDEIDLILSDNSATNPGDEGAENVKELELVGANKLGFARPGDVAVFEITPSASLASTYAESVNVIIDGKEYSGLAILSNPLNFHMDKDHKVVIDWLHGEISESFRIVVNR